MDDDDETVFVWEREYSINTGLFQWNGLYESINNNNTNNSICWKYAILNNNTLNDGGEEIDKIDIICTQVKSICDNINHDDDDDQAIIDPIYDENKICATNKVDLVIILDITLNKSIWNQLQLWIENIIIDVHNKLMKQQDEYSEMYNTFVDILFRVSLITFGNELYDFIQLLDVYNWGNQKVLLNNLLYDINEIIVENPNITTTAELS